MSITFLNELIATFTEQGRSLIERKRGTPAAASDLAAMCDALYSHLGEASGAALASGRNFAQDLQAPQARPRAAVEG